MARTRVRLDLRPAWEIKAEVIGMAAPHVAETTRMILNRARVLANVDTGAMRAGMGMRMQPRRNSVTGVVYVRARYAVWVHDGTDPHLIKAKRRGALQFPNAEGVLIYRRVVNHPGYRGNPFMRKALAEVATPRGYKVTGYSSRAPGIGFGLASE